MTGRGVRPYQIVYEHGDSNLQVQVRNAMRSKGFNVQGIVDKIVIIGDSKTAGLARNVKELSVMQVKAWQMMQREVVKSMGSGI